MIIKNIEKKKKIVNDLTVFLNDVSIVSLINYSGVKSLDLKFLRKNLSCDGIFIRVVKNSLAKKIFRNIGFDILSNDIHGQFLIIAGKDIFATINALDKLSKVNDKFLIFKVAIGNSLVSNDLMNDLLSFGSNFNILLKLVYVLKMPLFNFINSLKLPVYSFTELIKFLKEKKGGYNNGN